MAPLPSIDLRPYRGPLHSCLADAITRFNDQTPPRDAYTLALTVAPLHATANVAIDTQASVERRMAEHSPLAFDRYATDEWGPYGTAPADFELPDYATLPLEQLPNQDETDSPFAVIDASGTAHFVDLRRDGGDALHRKMFPTWIGFMKDFSQWRRLRQGEVFRYGVVMHETNWAKYFKN